MGVEQIIEACERLMANAGKEVGTESDEYHGREPSCCLVRLEDLDGIRSALFEHENGKV